VYKILTRGFCVLKDEIRQVLEGSCNLIPLKIVSSECVKLADDFIPELIDTLASRMDPNAVCSISGLCNSAYIDELLGEMKELVPKKASSVDLSTDSCPKCSYFMGKVVGYFRKMKEEDLKNKMLEACGHLDSYSDGCRMAVIEDFDTIFSHVQNDMDPDEICGLIGLCQLSSIHKVGDTAYSTGIAVWTPPAGVSDDDLECDFCKQLTEYVRKWLVADTTKVEFADIVKGLCRQTGKYRQECLDIARQYGKPLYQMLIDVMDPEEVCERIGVCPNKDGVKRIAVS